MQATIQSTSGEKNMKCNSCNTENRLPGGVYCETCLGFLISEAQMNYPMAGLGLNLNASAARAWALELSARRLKMDWKGMTS